MNAFPNAMTSAVVVIATGLSTCLGADAEDRSATTWAPKPVLEYTFDGAAPEWDATAGHWQAEGGQLVVRDAPANGNAVAYSTDTPFLDAQRVEVTVRVRKRIVTAGWSFAGVTVFGDSSNLWLLAFTEGPNDERYIDFLESYQGVWQAQNADGTRLERVTAKDTHTRWEYERPYRLRLEIGVNGVKARVTDLAAEGRLVAAAQYRFGKVPAVNAGAPGLIARGMDAAFDDFTVWAQRESVDRSSVAVQVEQGPNGNLAILRDKLPGMDLDSVDRLAGALRKAGFGVTFLSGEAVCDPRVLSPQRFFLYIVPNAGVYPGDGNRALALYLRRHGNLLTLGGPAFSRPVWQRNGEWIDRAIIKARVQRQKPRHTALSFDAPDSGKGWTRSTNQLSIPSTVRIEDAGPARGRVLRIETADLSGWNTYYSPSLDHLYGPGDDLLCFFAKGDANTSQLAVEVDEADGARWIATAPLATDWQYVVLSPEDFNYWPDSKVGKRRGNSGDHLQCANARKVCFGLTGTHTPRVGGGPHTFWVGAIGTAQSPYGGLALQTATALPSIETIYPSYKTYPLPGIAKVRMVSGQAILPAIAGLQPPTDTLACIARPHGTGFGWPRKWRWAPLIEAVGADGERRGALLWALLNRKFPYKGAVFAGCGLCNQAEATSPPMLAALTALVQRIRGGVFLAEGGTNRFSYRPGEAVMLGAEVNNSSDREVNAEVRIRVRVPETGTTVCERTGKLRLAARRSGAFSTEWTPDKSGPDRYTVTTKLRFEGATVDRITHDFGILPTNGARADFVRVQGNEFVVGGKVWRPVGINYWPLYVSGMDAGDYWSGWLKPTFYAPEEIERDLSLMNRLGMNMVSIQLGGLDCIPNLLDFLRRCRRHGIRVNGFLSGASPLAFDDALVQEFLRKSQLPQNPVLYAYDIIWEPGNWVFRNGQRQKWDPDWQAWVTERYGSVAAAEADWGFHAPRTADEKIGCPTERQIRENGKWRVMTAAYRRFMDDLMSRKWRKAVQRVRQLDPNHLISFRQGNTLPQDFTFTATPKHIDFICPEGYSIPNNEDGYNAAGFITRYVHFTTRGKPIVWSEFGTSVWDRIRMQSAPTEFNRQAAYHDLFYRMLLEAGANGTAPWWWPGGYRVGERSDFGIVNPDGTPRPAAELIRKYSAAIQAASRTYPKADEWLTIDRDAHPGGYWYITFHQGKDAYARARNRGKNLGIRTAGTGTTSMDTPLMAVGNRPYTGHNPPKYLDAEFNRLEVQNANGKWVEAEDGAVIQVKANAPVKARVSVGNLQEATWIPPAEAHGKPGAVYLVATPASELRTRVALPTRTPYLGNADFGKVILGKRIETEARVELQLTADRRMAFGEKRTFTLKPIAE